MTREKTTGSSEEVKQYPKGRLAQFGFFFADALQKFFQHRSWMVLPMTAVLSLIAGLAVQDDFLITMEGTMTGSFLLVGICIWNGAFSSIQAICRDRAVIIGKDTLKLHLTSYAFAHMLLQLIVCVLETLIMLVMLQAAGIKITGGALITEWFIADFGITILLITYASDIVALFLSALCRTKTAAMTILPFVLVVQLVFSGSVISIPDSIDPFAMITVSRPGFKAMAAQTDLNNLPFATVENVILGIEDTEFSGSITFGQVLDLLSDADNPTIQKARSMKIGGIRTVGEVYDVILHDDRFRGLRDTSLIGKLTIGDLMTEIDDMKLLEDYRDKEIGMEFTLGEVADMLSDNKQLSGFRNEGISVKMTVGEVLDLIGREKTQSMIEEKAGEKYYDPAYVHSVENVLSNWVRLLILLCVFSAMTIIALEAAAAWTNRKSRR